MRQLIERLSADLVNYQIEADHWQRKYLEFTNAIGEETLSVTNNEGQKDQRQSSATNNEPRQDSASEGSAPIAPDSTILPISDEMIHFDLIDLDTTDLLEFPSSSDQLATFDYEMIGKLQSTANPTLSLVSIPHLPFQSSVGSLSDDRHFVAVLNSVSDFANVFGMASVPGTPRWHNISLIKPDFSETKARTIWNDIFAPIHVNPSRFVFDSAPASRREIEYEVEDPDMDHMDRLLAKLSDTEIVDFLHYLSLLISGMHQVVFEDKSLLPLRDHLGRNAERLLREVIFTRNMSSNPKLAKSLFDGILGTIGYFSARELPSAVMSILELAWQINVQHENMIHPLAKALVAMRSIIMAPTPSKRTLWKLRSDENAQLAEQNSFHLKSTALITSSYFSLLMSNEEELLVHLSQLDEMLAPSSDPNQPCKSYVDEGTHFTFFTPSHEDDPSSTEHWLKKSPGSVSDTNTLSYRTHASSRPTTEISPIVLQDSDAINPLTEPVMDSDPSETDLSSSWGILDTYTPAENTKAVLRVLVHLIRAEASLVWSDQAACRHWVDEAERTWATLPIMFNSQREDIFLLQNVFKATCQFSTGTRTVAQEFERRMVQRDQELIARRAAAM
jgi:hypothetical protein